MSTNHVTFVLTDSQAKSIALDWIAAQQREPGGYKEVLRALLSGAHMSVWSWSDALKFAVKLCSNEYFVARKHILEEL